MSGELAIADTTYMSVAQYVPFQTQIKLFDGLATTIRNVDIDEYAAAAYPYLSV